MTLLWFAQGQSKTLYVAIQVAVHTAEMRIVEVKKKTMYVISQKRYIDTVDSKKSPPELSDLYIVYFSFRNRLTYAPIIQPCTKYPVSSMPNSKSTTLNDVRLRQYVTKTGIYLRTRATIANLFR